MDKDSFKFDYTFWFDDENFKQEMTIVDAQNYNEAIEKLLCNTQFRHKNEGFIEINKITVYPKQRNSGYAASNCF